MLNSTSLNRLIRRTCQSFRGRPKSSPRDRHTAAAAACVVENLESRTLQSISPDPGGTFNTAHFLGDLNGAQILTDAVGSADKADYYKFSMPRAGKFYCNLRASTGSAEIALLREVYNANGSTSILLVDSRTAATDYSSGELPGRVLQSGNYFLAVQQVSGESPYTIRMQADYAGDGLNDAHDLGIAQDKVHRDYIGAVSEPSLNDLIDVYKFKMEAKGTVTVTTKLDDPNARSYFQFIYDANNSGTIEKGELLFQTFAGNTCQIVGLEKPTGTYYVRVINDLRSSNYSLSLNADYAGGNGGLARDFGSPDLGKTFNDYISLAGDRQDLYRLNVSTKRELYLGMAQEDTGTSQILLYKDVNGNSEPEASELLQATSAASFTRVLRTIDAGQYLVMVQGSSGSGKYSITAETRPDQAGNTLATAKTLGTVNGLSRQNEYVSAADTVDFYRFTAATAGTISAQLNPDLGNADLALIRDANNNGKVDAGEVLAASSLTGTQADKLSKSITAGNYFLRVTHGGGSDAKYYLTFHTDYAGGTPATARGVGALSGVRTFDDWASGNFGGVISDTVDLYKFSLAATKTVTAKLIGTLKGQDLALQIYRDKNGNGVLEATELVAASDRANSPDEQIIKSLAAGTYFARVVGLNGETNYRLSLQA